MARPCNGQDSKVSCYEKGYCNYRQPLGGFVLITELLYHIGSIKSVIRRVRPLGGAMEVVMTNRLFLPKP